MVFSSSLLRSALKSIGAKILLSMAIIIALIIFLAISGYVVYKKVVEDTAKVSRTDIPSAILSISMLDEIDDMNANVMGHMLGKPEKRKDFESNRSEFINFMDKLKIATGSRDKNVLDLENLFNQYYEKARADIFSRYDPEKEAWAKQRISALISYTGKELETLLNTLKQSEIDDAGHTSDFNELLHDDLPGVHYYLALVDKAGDMTSDLLRYIDENEDAQEQFIKDSQDFEIYLGKIKPLENKAEEIEQLNQVLSLFSVLRDGGYEVFRHYDPKTKNSALQAIDELDTQIFFQLERMLDKLASEANTTANTSLEELRNISETSFQVLSFLRMTVILLCIGITYYVYRTVIRPLSELAAIMLRLADGDTDINVRYTDKHDEIGDMAKAIGIFKHNLIARMSAESALISAKVKAESATQTKARFLASMSHEIRTPMNGIIGLIDLLASSKLPPEQHNMTVTIRDSALSLLNILNDILDFSKIEAGKLALDFTDFSLQDMVESIMDTLAANADKNNVKLELFIDPDIPLKVHSDTVRLRQILFNLIGNAIKFSASKQQQGLVRLEVQLKHCTETNVSVVIVITDNGIGIKNEDMEKLFQPFEQAESSTTRRFGGTGLGLIISKTLVDLLGGQMQVESEVGRGSCFSVLITLSRVINELPPYFASAQKIVVFQFIQSEWIKHCVERYLTVYKISHQSGDTQKFSEQIKRLPDKQIALILSDKQTLPAEMDSLSLSAKDNLRFLLLNYGMRGERIIDQNTFMIGASPLKLSALLHGFNVLIGDESSYEVDANDCAEEEAPVLSIEKAEALGRLILVAEDYPANQTVIQRQLNRLGYACVIANDGLEAEVIYPKHRFALVMTDCHMPNRDGYQLAGILRAIQEKQGRRIPIIAITADAIQGASEKCFAAGMDDYLSKPMTLKQLKHKLDHWLNDAQPLPSRNEDVELAESPLAAYQLDASVFEELFDGSAKDYAASLEDFLTFSLPQFIAIRESLDEDIQLTVIAQLMHRLKASAKTIGAILLSDCCEKIEMAAKSNNSDTAIEHLRELMLLVEQTESLVHKKINALRGR